MDDTRQRLINVAGEIFAAKGFDATTVREICTAAEANIAAVHYHFGDKQRLYTEVVRIAHCQSGGLATFEWDDDTPPEQRFRDFVREFMAKMIQADRPDWQTQLMMREMYQPSGATREVVEDEIRPMCKLLDEILRLLLPEETSSRQLHLHAFSVIGQCLLYRYHRPVGRILVGDEEYGELFNLDLLTDQIVRFSLEGLRGVRASLEIGTAS